MIKQPLVLSGVLWLGMAIVGAGGSGAGDGSQTVIQPPKADEIVTIVGCLVRGDPALNASQPSPDIGVAATGDFFVRTPAIQIPVGATLTIGGSGTSGSGSTTSAGTPDKTTLYRVMGLGRDELRQHVGQRVELRGYLLSDDEALGVATKTTVDAAGRPTTSVEQRMDLAGALQATAITMINASCE
jgi:hypothetical protein